MLSRLPYSERVLRPGPSTFRTRAGLFSDSPVSALIRQTLPGGFEGGYNPCATAFGFRSKGFCSRLVGRRFEVESRSTVASFSLFLAVKESTAKRRVILKIERMEGRHPRQTTVLKGF